MSSNCGVALLKSEFKLIAARGKSKDKSRTNMLERVEKIVMMYFNVLSHFQIHFFAKKALSLSHSMFKCFAIR